MLVAASIRGLGCCTPGVGGERHTIRPALPPWYRPMRYAVAVKVGAAVDTNRSTASPCSTLVRLANPRTLSQTLWSWGTSQSSVPCFCVSSAIVTRWSAGLPVAARAGRSDPGFSSSASSRSMPQIPPATGRAARAASTVRRRQ